MSFLNTQLIKKYVDIKSQTRKNMSFSNMQLIKNMSSQLFLWHHKPAKNNENMTFLNTQLVKNMLSRFCIMY